MSKSFNPMMLVDPIGASITGGFGGEEAPSVAVPAAAPAAAPTPAAAPAPPAGPTEQEKAAAAEEEKKKKKGGARGTILTGSLGVGADEQTTGKKTLLGT